MGISQGLTPPEIAKILKRNDSFEDHIESLRYCMGYDAAMFGQDPHSNASEAYVMGYIDGLGDKD